MFKLTNISKLYRVGKTRRRLALNSVSLTLPKSGLVCLCGKSGSGKSTLLNIMGGLDNATSGEISFDGINLSKLSDNALADFRNKNIGFVFQEFNLIENINVGQNIGIALSLQNNKDTALIKDVLTKVGLEDCEKRKIKQLSGGEKQRVAIARAIIKNPKVILADEPTGHLDIKTGKEIFELLKSLSHDRLVVVVTHDIKSAESYSDYIIELDGGRITKNTYCEEEIEAKIVNLEYNMQTFLPDAIDEVKPIKKQKTSLPFALALKMGADNLCRKSFKALSIILAIIATVFCVTASQLFFSFSEEKALAKSIDNKGIETIKIYDEYYANKSTPLRPSILENIKTNYPEIELHPKQFGDDDVYIYSLFHSTLPEIKTEGLGEWVALVDRTLAVDTDIELNSSEVILSLEAYNLIAGENLAGENLKVEDFIEFEYLEDGSRYPVSMTSSPFYKQYAIFDIGERISANRASMAFMIKGIAFESETNNTDDKPIYAIFSQDGITNLFEEFNKTIINISTQSVDDLESFFEDINKPGVHIDMEVYDLILRGKSDSKNATNVFYIISVILVIVLILFVINNISILLLNRSKEMGILKSLGAKNNDLLTIVFSETMILALVVCVLSLLTAFMTTVFLNFSFRPERMIVLFFINPAIIISALILPFLLIVVATIPSFLKVKKMKPNEAIKRNKGY